MFNAMTRAEIWLQDTLDKSLGIEDFANPIGYSFSQVRRRFRQCFHFSPSAKRGAWNVRSYYLHLRLFNIAQIAIRCGYHSHSSFSRAFQRRDQFNPCYLCQMLKNSLASSMPSKHYKTEIEKISDRQIILMRL